MLFFIDLGIILAGVICSFLAAWGRLNWTLVYFASSKPFAAASSFSFRPNSNDGVGLWPM